MTLSQAFIWRSRFQKYLNGLYDALRIAPEKINLFKEQYFLEPLSKEEIDKAIKEIDTNKKFLMDGENTIDDLWRNYNKIEEALEVLQNAIDIANVSNGALKRIHEVQNLQKKLKIANVFFIRDNEPEVEEKKIFVEKEYNPDSKSLGRMAYSYLYPATTSDWKNTTKEIERKIRDLTDELTAINGTTKLTFSSEEESLLREAQQLII